MRVTTLASALGARINGVASKPSGLKAVEAHPALVASRVSVLEAASAHPKLDDGEAAFVVVDLRPEGDALYGYISNIKIGGLVTFEDRNILEPSAREALTKIEILRFK